MNTKLQKIIIIIIIIIIITIIISIICIILILTEWSVLGASDKREISAGTHGTLTATGRAQRS